jgi:hypothetical protein
VTWVPSELAVWTFSPVAFAKMLKTIFVPSGDQRGLKQLWEVGSAIGPPHAG